MQLAFARQAGSSQASIWVCDCARLLHETRCYGLFVKFTCVEAMDNVESIEQYEEIPVRTF